MVLPSVVLVLAGKSVSDRVAWLTRMLAIVTVAQVGTAALQYIAGFDIGFSKFSYQRGAGLTAGPYELGAMCALLTCFWLVRKRYALCVVSLAGVAMSQSRISIAAVLVAIAILLVAGRQTRAAFLENSANSSSFPERPYSQLRRVGSTVVVTLGIVVLLLFSTQIVQQLVVPVVSRVGSTSLTTSWVQAGLIAQREVPVANSLEYESIAYGTTTNDILQNNSAADASNLVRFYRWHLLLNAMSNPSDYLFGLGPSFAGPSVDGAFLRIYVESGFFGIVAWFLYFLRWFQRNPVWFKAAALTLLIGSLFIDLPFSLRPMVLLWVLFAIARAEGNWSAHLSSRIGAEDAKYYDRVGRTSGR